MENNKGFAQKFPLLFGILTCVMLAIALKYIPASNFFQMAILRFGCALVAILIMWPVLGFKYLKNSKSGWAFTFKLWKWPLIFTIAITVVSVVYNFILLRSAQSAPETQQIPANKDLVINLISYTILIVTVGIVEELSYRRGLFVTSVMQFPKLKNRIMVMAILSSIVFGFAHVIFSLSTEASAIISIILKTLESGMFGFIMCACLLESKNIWPLATMHFLMDYLIAVPQVIQGSSMVKREYVLTGFGVLTIVGYGVIIITILVYLKPFINSIKYIKDYEANIKDNGGLL